MSSNTPSPSTGLVIHDSEARGRSLSMSESLFSRPITSRPILNETLRLGERSAAHNGASRSLTIRLHCKLR